MRRRGLPLLKRRMVVANIDNGQAIRGVLTGIYPDVLVLEQASYVAQTETEMAGRVILPRARVLWLQDPGPEALAAPGDQA